MIGAESFERLRRLVARPFRSVEEYASDPGQDGDSPAVLAAVGSDLAFDMIERPPSIVGVEDMPASRMRLCSAGANATRDELRQLRLRPSGAGLLQGGISATAEPLWRRRRGPDAISGSGRSVA